MRFLIGCVFSALMASLFTIWLVSGGGEGALTAQERRLECREYHCQDGSHRTINHDRAFRGDRIRCHH